MQNNSCSRKMRGVAENRCSRNKKFIIEVTAKVLRNKYSGKKN